MEIDVIKKIREAYNLNREDFAEKLNITIDTLNTWEYRTKSIPKRKIAYIKNVFSSFFNGDEISTIPENYYVMVEFYDLNELKQGQKINLGKIDILPENKKRLISKSESKGNCLVVRVTGHSMDDNTKRSLSDGDEILIKEYTDSLESLPIRTKLFVIVTIQGVVLKQVTKNQHRSITCHSFNQTHEDFILDYDDIQQIFTVERKVRSNIIF